MRHLVTAILALLVTAAAGLAAAQAATPQSTFQYAAVVENGLWVENQALADAKAELIAQAGFNTVRIFVPYSPGQAEIDNDHDRLCVAATAAQKSGLQLIVSFHGVDHHGKPGFIPQSYTGITKYIKTINDHMYWLFGENGCTKDVHDFIVEIMNEPNSPTFWRPQYDAAGNWIAPADYVNLLARVYPAVHAKAAELGVNLTVIGGALAASHDPLGFIAGMGRALRAQNVSGPIFDWFSFHPYPGGQLGIGGYDLLRRTLDKAFAWRPPVFYSEFGIESQIPLTQQYLYDGPEDPNAISEDQQGAVYSQAFGLAASQPNVVGLAIFHMFDDPARADWQSGLYYADPFGDPNRWQAKSSLPAVCQAAYASLGKPSTDCGQPVQP